MNPSTPKTILAELTVIVPTFGRPIAAEAIASQWAPQVGHMIIVDGSKMPSGDAFNRFPNVTYVHDPRAIEVRLGRASELVATRFAMLQSDDDVFVPSAIAACISELERNSAYCAVSPTAIRVDGQVLAALSYPSALRWDNSASLRAERIKHLGRNYTPSCLYGVCRSQALKASLLTMAKDPVPVYAFWELHHEFVVNGLGGVKVMPVVGWLRRDSYASIDSRDKSQGVPWFADPDSEQRERFVQGVTSALSEAMASSLSEVRNDVEAGLAAYAEGYLAARRQRTQRFRQMYQGCVPRPIKRAIKITRRVCRRRRGRPMDSKTLAAQGILLPDDALKLLEARIKLEYRLTKVVRK